MPNVAEAPQAGSHNLPVDKSRSGTSQRRHVFVHAYMSNGQNATQAAIFAGYSEKTAYSQGQRLLKNVETRRQLAEAARAVAERVELDADRTMREIARIAYSDPRRLFREDGTLIPMHELPEDVSAAVASYEAEGRSFKIKFWSKVEALNLAMKHAGLFERDNRELAQNLAIQINLVEAP